MTRNSLFRLPRMRLSKRDSSRCPASDTHVPASFIARRVLEGAISATSSCVEVEQMWREHASLQPDRQEGTP